MGLEEVKKDIIDNAKAQAKKILDSAKEESLIIVKASEARVNERRSAVEQESRKQIENYKTATMAETNSLLKRERLMLEKKLLEEAFEIAKEKLAASSGKKRDDLLKSLMKIKGLEIGKVYCSKKDMKTLNEYSPVETDILGGVIIEDKKGETRVDLSYETLLDSIKQDDLNEIAKTMFG